MTVPSADFRNDYDGDGTTATYAYTFRIFTASMMKVIIHDSVIITPDVVLVEGVDYTVTGVRLAGGTVILTDDTGLLVGGCLPAGKTITLIRQVPLVQDTDLRNQGKYYPESIEDALDYLMMVAQQQQDAVNRTLKVLESQPTDSDSLTFPSIAERANQLLGFDADGNPIAVSAGGAVSGSWQTLIDAMNYVGARNLLGFQGTGGTVQTANIAPEGLAAAALASLAVTTAKLNDQAVTTAKIADANVTLAKLAADAIGSVAIPGELKAIAHSTIPTGWLICDGAAVSRATYAGLFAVLGSFWGSGDGATTFNIPNLKGRILRGISDYADSNGSGTAAANYATFTAHPYKQTGVEVRLKSGALTGLATATSYWVIVIDVDTLAFATTRANALGGTRINLSGTNTAVIEQWDDPDAGSRVASTIGGDTGAAVGTFQDDGFESHTHTGAMTANPEADGQLGSSVTVQKNPTNVATGATGGNETRPKNVAVNYIIKT